MSTEPKTFRKKPVEIQAMQWDGDYDTADALWEWTQFVVSRKEDGAPPPTEQEVHSTRWHRTCRTVRRRTDSWWTKRSEKT